MKVTLGQRSRVKVNSKRVTVPLVEKRLLIERKDDLIVAVMNDVGVKVSWDGSNFLEVSFLSASFLRKINMVKQSNEKS